MQGDWAATRPDRTGLSGQVAYRSDRVARADRHAICELESNASVFKVLSNSCSRSLPFLIAHEDAKTSPERQKRSVGIALERARRSPRNPTHARTYGFQMTISPCVKLNVFVGSLQFWTAAAFWSR